MLRNKPDSQKTNHMMSFTWSLETSKAQKQRAECWLPGQSWRGIPREMSTQTNEANFNQTEGVSSRGLLFTRLIRANKQCNIYFKIAEYIFERKISAS